MNNIQEEIASITKQIEDLNKHLDSEKSVDMKAMLQEEIEKLSVQKESLESTINIIEGNYSEVDFTEDSESIISPNQTILEIRAGTGGDEAGLFAHDLYRMYQRYGETKGWKFKEIFRSDNLAGGLKTISAEIKGSNVYNLLKNESGVHRVQRIPATESSGRIHTSTATVAVLPHLNKIKLEIKPEDLQWDFFRAGGHGGQNVNKVSTAVRLTHIPTQTVVECQEERTQGRNRDKALDILNSILYKNMQEQRVKNISDLRSSQVGTADRSEKIRTYNYPQNRVTDHRIQESWHNLTDIMEGNINSILLTLQEKIKDNSESQTIKSDN